MPTLLALQGRVDRFAQEASSLARFQLGADHRCLLDGVAPLLVDAQPRTLRPRGKSERREVSESERPSSP